MSAAELKLTIYELLASTKDSKVLSSIYKLLKSQKPEKGIDFWDEFTAEQKAEIEASIAEADRGDFITHEEVMKEIKSRYKI